MHEHGKRQVLAPNRAVRGFSCVVAALHLLGSQPGFAAIKPLQPAGGWAVGVEKGMCIARRNFGIDRDRVTLQLSFNTFGPDGVLKIIEASRRDEHTTRDGSIEAGGRSYDAEFSRYPSTTFVALETSFGLEPEVLSAVETAPNVTLSAGRQIRALVDARIGAAAQAIRACMLSQLKILGIDPQAVAAIAKPAEPAPDVARWITSDDYPNAAIKARVQGEVVMLWSIDESGRAGDCRVIHSSGSALLNTASCATVMKRARYAPALDKEGRPIRSWSTRQVVWKLF